MDYDGFYGSSVFIKGNQLSRTSDVSRYIIFQRF